MAEAAASTDAVSEGYAYKLREDDAHTYTVLESLGYGGNGVVYAAERSDGLKVALKFVPSDKVFTNGRRTVENRRDPLSLEAALMLRVPRHQNIITLHDFLEKDDGLILVLERPEPVNDLFLLIEQAGAFNIRAAKFLFKQVVEAAAHCHASGVFHQDIKPDNVIVELRTGRAILIDFGSGDELRRGYYNGVKGTPIYKPPEIFKDRCYRAEPATVWSLGLLLFSMVTGGLPFVCPEQACYVNPLFPGSPGVSRACRNFIALMLKKKPEDRLKLQQVVNHAWLVSDDVAMDFSDPKNYSRYNRRIFEPTPASGYDDTETALPCDFDAAELTISASV